ncbi:hypothetical protein SAY86_011534 [Trapa natans]|uniref:Uncharacterized protein n=1 Tax=Trapa natans TaxID=22666 RepID=A0AAN7LZE7_TRANT|nr:hypothetical protein SAY86_011534 [Trapa natans]
MLLVDRRLGSNFNEDEAVTMIRVAILCTNAPLSVRPPMSSVAGMLENKVAVPISDPSSSASNSMKINAMMKHFMGSTEEDEGPWLVVEAFDGFLIGWMANEEVQLQVFGKG